MTEVLLQTFGDHIKDANITVTGEASPEGDSAESLAGKDTESTEKNTQLAYARAKYVLDTMKSLYPNDTRVQSLAAQVQTLISPLSDADITHLATMARSMNIAAGDEIHLAYAMIKAWNSGQAVERLSDTDRQFILDHLKRKVTVHVAWQKRTTNENMNFDPGDEMWHIILEVLTAFFSVTLLLSAVSYPKNNPPKVRNEPSLKHPQN